MWNYRVVRKKNTYINSTNKEKRVAYTYAIHEAYYDRNGYVGSITQDSVEPFGENVEENKMGSEQNGVKQNGVKSMFDP